MESVRWFVDEVAQRGDLLECRVAAHGEVHDLPIHRFSQEKREGVPGVFLISEGVGVATKDQSILPGVFEKIVLQGNSTALSVSADIYPLTIP